MIAKSKSNKKSLLTPQNLNLAENQSIESLGVIQNSSSELGPLMHVLGNRIDYSHHFCHFGFENTMMVRTGR